MTRAILDDPRILSRFFSFSPPFFFPSPPSPLIKEGLRYIECGGAHPHLLISPLLSPLFLPMKLWWLKGGDVIGISFFPSPFPPSLRVGRYFDLYTQATLLFLPSFFPLPRARGTDYWLERGTGLEVLAFPLSFFLFLALREYSNYFEDRVVSPPPPPPLPLFFFWKKGRRADGRFLLPPQVKEN